jgi:MerR family transcriptional regulator, copper efflux regulator
MKSRTWSVGEVADRFGVATSVLRHWEEVGLVRPGRDGAGRRQYGEDDVARLAAVVRGKESGMSLEQVAVLLDGSQRQRHELLEAHVAELDQQVAALRRARAMTEHAFDCRAHDLTTCPGFRATVADLVEGFSVE